MPAPKVILDLVARFRDNEEAYRRDYGETETRREFLDPFFKALGWDIDNTSGNAEAYKDVVHEDSVKVGFSMKAPDYSFRVGGIRKFFLEAKKPAVNIKDDNDPAFQLRRYAWSAKMPLSVLSNFAGFAVYDCRVKPKQSDKANAARTMYFTYKDYATHWDEIAAIFSKDALYKGSFDKYATGRGRRGTAEVDDAFLEEIEQWRNSLAHNIALRNSKLTQPELNFAVQQTIDRIIFLRICEDRGIEPYGRLKGLQNGENVYARLKQFFHYADERYNSGLFHFNEEKGRPHPDELTLQLKIDDKALKDIFDGLYYPDSPYEFSVLPADILGQVYEQFLGKVIRLTAGGHAKVEDKPEVKKAGGVYYTPTYIVDYIVKHTVGRLLESGTPDKTTRLKILDPACGSGSFLLGAYQYLLNWHRDWYSANDPEKHARGRPPRIYRGPGGSWRLTTAERKRILLNNIYGVDIDLQAVEVTKLSLLLKVLEEESGETLGKNWEMFHERALPDLDSNIKCGNSLIGPDFYEGKFDFDEDERYRINAFDWSSEFKDIISKGGFDIVIGNPPYRRELDYKELMDEIAVTRFGKRFRAPRMDLWYYFVHRALELLKKGGVLSYIVNAYWMAGTGAERLIQALRTEAHIDEVFFLGKLQIFRDVAGQHMIFRATNGSSTAPTLVSLADDTNEGSAEPCVLGKHPLHSFPKDHDQLYRNGKIDIQPPSDDFLSKLESGKPLKELGIVRQGIAENPAAINKKTNQRFGDKWTIGQGVFVLSLSETRALKLPAKEKTILRPYHELRDLGRYLIKSPSAFLIYSTKQTCPDINAFPGVREHLKRFRVVMEERRETRNQSNGWWHLHWPRDESIWRSPKILSIQMARRPSFVPASTPTYVPFSVNVFVPFDTSGENINYITGLLNSRAMWAWFLHSAKRRGVGLEINGHVFESAPVRQIDPKNPKEKRIRDKIIALVEQIINTNAYFDAAKTAQEKTQLRRQIDATDREIDQLVYELYGLTPEEAKLVENRTSE